MADATQTLRHAHGVLVLAACVALCACGSTAPERREALAERRLRLSALIADDPVAERRVRAAACAVALQRCAALRVFVLKGDAPVADYRPGGVLRVSLGLLARAADDAALAFVVAHELAHETLGHFTPATKPAPQIEVAADARARELLAMRGLPIAPAVAMLQGLLDEARSNPGADPAGVAELEMRLAALREPR